MSLAITTEFCCSKSPARECPADARRTSVENRRETETRSHAPSRSPGRSAIPECERCTNSEFDRHKDSNRPVQSSQSARYRPPTAGVKELAVMKCCAYCDFNICDSFKATAEAFSFAQNCRLANGKNKFRRANRGRGCPCRSNLRCECRAFDGRARACELAGPAR